MEVIVEQLFMPEYEDWQYPENNHKYLRDHLKSFYKYLQNNRKLWAILQIKNAMITGKRHVFLGKLQSRDYKRGRKLFNIFKWDQINKNKYYHKKSNLLITNPKWKAIIDIMVDLGMHWYPNHIWESDMFLPSYAELIVIWPLDYHLTD